jgi:hypothetical protein
MENDQQRLYDLYNSTYTLASGGKSSRYSGQLFDAELGYYRDYNSRETLAVAIASQDVKLALRLRSRTDFLAEFERLNK